MALLPVLLGVDGTPASARRHGTRDSLRLTEVFEELWSSYRKKDQTPFRRNILSLQTAPTSRHIAKKCFEAISQAPCLIYVFGQSEAKDEQSHLRLQSGQLLNISNFVRDIEIKSKFQTVIILDIVGRTEPISVSDIGKVILVRRTVQNSANPDQEGGDVFTGEFCRVVKAVVRHAPFYTIGEVLNASWSRPYGRNKGKSAKSEISGNTDVLSARLVGGVAVSSLVTQDYIERLESNLPGTIEDGLQELWSAVENPKLQSEAKGLAMLIGGNTQSKALRQSSDIIEKYRPSWQSSGHRTAMPERHLVQRVIDDLIDIPAGNALIGSDPDCDQDTLPDEVPQHQVWHDDFSIAKTHVTNEVWHAYLMSTKDSKPTRLVGDDANKPVTYVSFYEALGFLDWLSRGALHYNLIEPDCRLTLPSEVEWEVAARGRDGSLYPWGNSFEPNCVYQKNSNDKVWPVGSFSPAGDSCWGLSDMAGNAWDWTRSLWGKSGRKPTFQYPYDSTDGRENTAASPDVRRVVRGGAYYYADWWCLRCATRNIMFPNTRHSGGGFRVTKVRDDASALLIG